MKTAFDPTLKSMPGGSRHSARVEITLTDGTRLSAIKHHADTGEDGPELRRRVIDKFLELTSGTTISDRRDHIVQTVMFLPELEDIRELTVLLGNH